MTGPNEKQRSPTKHDEVQFLRPMASEWEMASELGCPGSERRQSHQRATVKKDRGRRTEY